MGEAGRDGRDVVCGSVGVWVVVEALAGGVGGRLRRVDDGVVFLFGLLWLQTWDWLPGRGLVVEFPMPKSHSQTKLD